MREANCEMTAMESTGVYWKPLYNLFELMGLEVMVVNAVYMKAVPGGRWTDWRQWNLMAGRKYFRLSIKPCSPSWTIG